MDNRMFEALRAINSRPKPFEFYTAADLWTEDHISSKMLAYHLNEAVDLSSRSKKFIDRSVSWILHRFKIEPGSKIIDFGCGPGLYTHRFTQAGAIVTGIDFSSSSIQYARGMARIANLEIDYLLQNYLEFESQKKYDLITMIMCDFCALSPNQRQQMLQIFRRILAPGGAVLLDVYTLEAFNQLQETAEYALDLFDGFWSAKPYYGFRNSFKYEEEKVFLDKFTIIERDRTRSIYNWLQHYSRSEIEAEFRANGFTIADIYADVAGTPYDSVSGEMALAAKLCM